MTDKTQRAVIKGLTDIGEAANNIMKLAPGLKQRNPDAWQHLDDVYAMRIRLTHTYTGPTQISSLIPCKAICPIWRDFWIVSRLQKTPV